MNLFENGQIVQAFAPVDLSTAGATGDWFDMSNYRGCNVVVVTAIGTAGDDVTIDMEQATSAAGAGNKDLNFTVVYTKTGATALTGVAQWTKNTQAADDEWTDATGAENQQMIGLYISAEDLDTSNGYTHIRVAADDVGTNAQLGFGIYIGTDPRYPQEPALSAIG